MCTPNPTGDGTMMLPSGKYVVEVIVPRGYELMKEEDKNILIGDNFIAPSHASSCRFEQHLHPARSGHGVKRDIQRETIRRTPRRISVP
ncbi:hypothetical protein ACFOPS_04705 [Ralstonia solanacearum]|uniref:hypothetical protein n=1 Tax=Ralstonia solanacearum TaxID=305 RepID=UPI00361A3B3E